MTSVRQPGDAPAAKDPLSGRKLRMLLCCAGAPFLIMLDTNIVAVSLPSVARDLHGGFTDVEWVVSAYILPFAALLMPAGAVADRRLQKQNAETFHHGHRARIVFSKWQHAASSLDRRPT
jgi:MFS family permease